MWEMMNGECCDDKWQEDEMNKLQNYKLKKNTAEIAGFQI